MILVNFCRKEEEMKLRNKKTGEIVDVLISAYGISGDVAVSVMDGSTESGCRDLGRYKTLTELNDEWEDYKPKEPLIKGEKYIGLFKYWVKVNRDTLDKTDKIFIYRKDDDMLFYNATTPICSYGIGFITLEVLEDLEDGKLYSYYDLVGEE